jgi:hypothetical protein
MDGYFQPPSAIYWQWQQSSNHWFQLDPQLSSRTALDLHELFQSHPKQPFLRPLEKNLLYFIAGDEPAAEPSNVRTGDTGLLSDHSWARRLKELKKNYHLSIKPIMWEKGCIQWEIALYPMSILHYTAPSASHRHLYTSSNIILEHQHHQSVSHSSPLPVTTTWSWVEWLGGLSWLPYLSINWIGDWVSPRATLKLVKDKSFWSGQKLKPGWPSHRQPLHWLSYTDFDF